MEPAIGLDFGTTNSAVALLDSEGAPVLAEYPGLDGATRSYRSILYFSRPDTRDPVEVASGPSALAARLSRDDLEGRLIQSPKSFLGSRLFTSTSIFGRRWTLDELVGRLLGDLRRAASAFFGRPVTTACVGRPVRFVGAHSAEDQELAIRRLRGALGRAGLTDLRFEYEPVAAARHYESRLDRDETVLIGDFGGGTSDFSVLRVGPSFSGHASRHDAILGTGGVPIAGDAFDGKIVRHRVSPLFGRGSEFESLFGQKISMPGWIYSHLERWHHVSFLRAPRTLQVLFDLERQAVDPAAVGMLVRVVEQDLGFDLHRSIEALKHALSEASEARLRFQGGGVDIDERVTRAEFEGWIEEELAAIAGCVDELLERVDVGPDRIDSVFLTGGSSHVPAVRRIFEDRFGAGRLRGGGELTSVASGLAFCAAEAGAGR